jgi:hypothetical protein
VAFHLLSLSSNNFLLYSFRHVAGQALPKKVPRLNYPQPARKKSGKKKIA